MTAEVLIGAGALVLSTTIPAWMSARRAKRVENAVGQKNGQGTLVQIGESLLLAFEEHAKLDERRFDEIRQQLQDGSTPQK